MLIYLCATNTALAQCLAQLPDPSPLGVLAAGDAQGPAQAQPAAAHVHAQGPLADADLAALRSCHTLYVDLGPGTRSEDLAAIRAALRDLAHTLPALVAGPNAMPLLGQAQGDAPEQALVPHTLIVPVLHQTPDVGWLMQPDAPRRLLAFDGDVYVAYDTEAAALTVHGAGSVLAVVLDEGDRRVEGAHAGVLTPGMRLAW